MPKGTAITPPSAHPTFSSTRDPDKPDAILCDIDGTLAHGYLSRGPYEPEKYSEDLVDEIVRSIVVNERNNIGTKVILVTGRDEQYRTVTEEWLKNNHVAYDALLMRPRNIKDKDYIVKELLLKNVILPAYNVKYVIEDRQNCVAMYRENKLKVLQVDAGEF